jgi:hypothetical protein
MKELNQKLSQGDLGLGKINTGATLRKRRIQEKPKEVEQGQMF